VPHSSVWNGAYSLLSARECGPKAEFTERSRSDHRAVTARASAGTSRVGVVARARPARDAHLHEVLTFALHAGAAMVSLKFTPMAGGFLAVSGFMRSTRMFWCPVLASLTLLIAYCPSKPANAKPLCGPSGASAKFLKCQAAAWSNPATRVAMEPRNVVRDMVVSPGTTPWGSKLGCQESFSR